MRDGTAPIIIKRIVEEGHGGHHGGAWKVAYADFVTAMMAFFLLLWLLSSASEDQLKGIAEYFSEATVNTGPPGGVGGVLQGITVQPDQPLQAPGTPMSMTASPPDASREAADGEPLAEPVGTELDGDSDAAGLSEEEYEDLKAEVEGQHFDRAKAAIEAAMAASPELARLKDSLLIDQTPEGLRIQLIDRDQYSMFPSGSDAMNPQTKALLGIVAKAVAGTANRVSIRGHTDSRPFAAGRGYDNWRLSSDRANATRAAMIEAGLVPARIADVIGKADTEPLLPDAPEDPRNRRISMVLLRDGPVPAHNVESHGGLAVPQVP